MTGDAVVRPAAARACDFIAASQHPVRGGWRYTPRSDADLSVSGWMLVALRSGQLAGVDVEPRALAGVKTLLDSSAVVGDPARYHYNPRSPQQRPSSLSAGCMTAVGTLMRLHTGSTAADPRVLQSARALAALRPTYGTGREKTRDCYLWYYASQVLVHTGGEEWADWYDELAATLEQTQERAGPRFPTAGCPPTAAPTIPRNASRPWNRPSMPLFHRPASCGGGAVPESARARVCSGDSSVAAPCAAPRPATARRPP
jgi:hypothetical protein